MARRTNSPLKTTILLLMLGGAGYFAYEYLVVRKVLAGSTGPVVVSTEQRQAIRDAILGRYEKDPCFVDLGPMSYRAKEDQWRVDFVVSDGCFDGARDLCHGIADLLIDQFRLTVSVWAYDGAGREVAHHVP